MKETSWKTKPQTLEPEMPYTTLDRENPRETIKSHLSSLLFSLNPKTYTMESHLFSLLFSSRDSGSTGGGAFYENLDTVRQCLPLLYRGAEGKTGMKENGGGQVAAADRVWR